MSAARIHRSLWAAILGVPILFAGGTALQVRIDAQTRSAAQQKEELLLQSGGLLKKMSLGYESLLADIYWTRSIQYYGTKLDSGGRDFDLLAPLLDMTTTLDPKLTVAYRFGAIFLAEPPPTGPGRPDLAIRLIERGAAANPSNWLMYFDLGFLEFWHFHDFDKAAAAYRHASELPGAPDWLSLLAARMSDKTEAIETSRMVWTRIFQMSRDPRVREKALLHLKSLRVELDESWLNDDSQEFHKKFGRYPVSVEELVKAGFIRGIPLDPDGFPYTFATDGKARLDPKSTVVLDAVPAPKPN